MEEGYDINDFYKSQKHRGESIIKIKNDPQMGSLSSLTSDSENFSDT